MVGRERRRKALAFRGTLQNVNVSLREKIGRIRLARVHFGLLFMSL